MGSSRKRFSMLLLTLAQAGLALFILPLFASAQDLSTQERGNSWLDVSFPRDSPVLIVSSGLGSTTARLRGTSIVLEIHTSLLLRNTGTKPINGLTLRVEAEDLTPKGRGSVTMPSLDVQPGDVFPVRIDMKLMRPFSVQRTQSPLVQVSLDCALFNDMTAYGPDKLGSKRALVVYEMEARRDRRYLANLLDTGRIAELRRELDFGLENFSLPQLALELLRGPSTGARPEQEPVAVEVMSFPSSPVDAVSGVARVLGNEVRGPDVEIRNRSRRQVTSIEMGWILRDDRGRDFVAGSVPAKIRLGPVGTARMTEKGSLRFLQQGGEPLPIEELLAFVNSVEFDDGSLWIPSRADISRATNDPVLRRELTNSPEQQRLASLYRRKGINALSADLKRVN